VIKKDKNETKNLEDENKIIINDIMPEKDIITIEYDENSNIKSTKSQNND
jgi:hypothetical protein